MHIFVLITDMKTLAYRGRGKRGIAPPWALSWGVIPPPWAVKIQQILAPLRVRYYIKNIIQNFSIFYDLLAEMLSFDISVISSILIF